MLDYCIIWPGFIDRDKYGQINSNSDGTLKTGRIVLSQKLGRKIKKNYQAHHTCHTRECINPLHLEEKSHREHALEKRHNILTKKSILKLTKSDVYLVKYLLRKNQDYLKICEFVKVTIVEEDVQRIEKLPIEMIEFIQDYDVWNYIYLKNYEKVEILQKLNNYYDLETCIEADWGDFTKCPVVNKKSKNILAHRYAYQCKTNEPIPKGNVIRHNCDNIRCVRISHLIIGSQADNMADKVRRKRHKREILLDNQEPEIARLIDIEGMNYTQVGNILAKTLGSDKPFDHSMIRIRYINYKLLISEKPKAKVKTQKELLIPHINEIIELKNFKGYSFKKISFYLSYYFYGKVFDQHLISSLYKDTMHNLEKKIPKTAIQILTENKQWIIELINSGKSFRAVAKIFIIKFDFKIKFSHVQVKRAKESS